MKVKNSRILVLPYTYMYCTVLYIWMEQMVTSSLPKKVSVDFLKVKSTVHQTKLRQCQNNLSQSFYKNYFFVFIIWLVKKICISQYLSHPVFYTFLWNCIFPLWWISGPDPKPIKDKNWAMAATCGLALCSDWIWWRKTLLI